MHDDRALVRRRIARFVRERVEPAVYREWMPVRLERWEAPGEPVPFAEAVGGAYTPVAAGDAWGRPWGTTWFRVTGEVPAGWAPRLDTPASGLLDDRDAAASTRSSRSGEAAYRDAAPPASAELVVDLGFTGAAPGFQAEALAWSADGRILKAVEPRNRAIPLPEAGPFELYLEAASNPDVAAGWRFEPTPLGTWDTSGDAPGYVLGEIRLGLLDREVHELAADIRTLRELEAVLPPTLPRAAEILRALERAIEVMDPDDVAGTAAAGRAVLAGALAAPAWASSHRVHAVGHAHIDSAWLWPVRETVRKVARTFSNVDALIEREPGFVFAASSAQQYAWLKEGYPELFERVRRRVAEGSFVPVGGMWVESDTNLPGGEALARQFVAGKRFFMREFGVEPLEVWLPDSFGYSAALPQIVRAAGSRWFLTQKISWNETNTFPHHTFRWQGIDGTEVFTHFPPVDTYNAELSGAELARAERQYAEKGRANTSLVPFGWGDGGGGPTREMVQAARRAADLEASPRVRMSTPRSFFEAAEAEYPDPPVWAGELYLEFHRGTYTSQARTKRGNRRSEHLLREAELWAATAAVRGAAPYPYDALERAWQTVLLHQFHDILPGSSIAWVHREAEARYAELAASIGELVETSMRALAGTGTRDLAFNAGPFTVDNVPALGAAPRHPRADRVELRRRGDTIVLENTAVRAVLDADGLLVSLVDRTTGRDAVPPGRPGKLLQLFRDTPAQWDAWDIDAVYERNGDELREAASIETGVDAGSARVRIERRFGASTVVETVTLAAGARALDIRFDIDWHERQKLLKLAFPLDVHAAEAASEIQFGHIRRPTHANTSWDAARFETVAHRWVHVGEPGFGVAVANDSTYGHDIRRTGDAAGDTVTTVRLSLLRAPRYPDPESDQGAHTLRVAIAPGAGIPDAVREGYRLNVPPRVLAGAAVDAVAPLVSVSGAVIEAVKLAEDRSGDVIVRLYEALGARGTVRVTASFDAAAAAVDLLERPLPGAAAGGAAPAAPGGAAPGGLAPAGAVPAGAVPAGIAPGGPAPAGAAPAAPAGAVPGGLAPAGAVPAGIAPGGPAPAGAAAAGVTLAPDGPRTWTFGIRPFQLVTLRFTPTH